MLVLSRRIDETIEITGGITIVVVAAADGKARIGITVSREVAVHRGEVARRIEAIEAEALVGQV